MSKGGWSRSAAVGAVLAVLVAGCAGDGGTRADQGAASPEPVVRASEGCDASTSTPVITTGTTARTLEFDGHVRTYRLSIPRGYDGVTPAPVVLNLHGMANTGAQVNTTSRMPERAGARGYVVVAPDSLGSTGDGARLWNLVESFVDPEAEEGSAGVVSPDLAVLTALATSDDVGYLDALLDELEDELCLDRAREYAAGESNGAGMATWLACQPEPRFAAFAPVAGVNMPRYCPGTDVPPVITFHGDADEPVPYDGDSVVGLDLGVPDVQTRLDELAAKQDCADPTDVRVAADVVHRTWDCPDGAGVELYRVLGGGHTWPGEDPYDAPGLGVTTQSIDATELMLDFFDANRLTG